MVWKSAVAVITPLSHGGGPITWWWSWGHGTYYKGPQLALASPLIGLGAKSKLKTYDFMKTREGDHSEKYYVTVANVGDFPLVYQLEGGGLT